MDAWPMFVPRTENITPEMANEWMAQQFEGQRNLRDHHVFLLAGEMERGSFVPHNAITFAVVGGKRFLIDGQHRLKAIYLYGKPVMMPVLDIPASDLDEVRRLYASIDQGLRRSTTDAIRAMGLTQELQLPERRIQRMAGALRIIAARFTDTTSGTSKGDARKRRSVTRSNAVSTQLLKVWESEIHQYYKIVEDGESSIVALFDRAAVLGCALLTIRYAPDCAIQFWGGAAKDDGLAMHDPRKRFINWLRDTNKPKSGDIARAFAVAWRYFIKGQELKLIRYNSRSPVELERIDLDRVELELQAAIGHSNDGQLDLLEADARPV
jgi:hypothetical protein